MRRLARIALLSATMVSSMAMAEEKENALSIFGSYTKSQGSSAFTSIFATYERLLDANISVGANVGISEFSGNMTLIVGGEGRYYFAPVGKVGMLAPYAGGSAVIIHNDFFDAYGLRALGGVEYALTEVTSAFAEFRLGRDFPDVGNDTNISELFVGLKFRF